MKTVKGLFISILVYLGTFKALAAGFHEIKIYSALNQPLLAEIPISNIGKENFEHMRVKLADPEKYAQYQIPYQSLLNELYISKAIGSDGMPLVRITSRRLMAEPALSLLVEFKTANSMLIRQYNILLDPPARAAGKPAVKNYHYQPKPDKVVADPNLAQAAATQPLLPSPEELKGATVPGEAAVAEESGPLLMLISKIEESAADIKYLLPVWLKQAVSDTAKSAQQIEVRAPAPTQDKKLAVASLAKSVASVQPKTIHALPLPVPPKADSNSNSLIWILLLIIAGGLTWRYRQYIPQILEKKLMLVRNNNAVQELKPSQAVTKNTIPANEGAAVQDSENELDPIEEAEVLIKYGRLEQAELVLNTAINKSPNRLDFYLKLLEVYGAMNKADAFKAMCEKIPYERGASDPTVTNKIQQLQEKYFPGNIAGADRIHQGLNVAVTEEIAKPAQNIEQHNNSRLVEEKISIARACIEMQDYQNAREILEELQGTGTIEQNEEILQLINKLPNNNVIDFN